MQMACRTSIGSSPMGEMDDDDFRMVAIAIGGVD